MSMHVESFHFQAGCNTLPEWVALFTLCLAPLIAHIVTGTAPISYVTHTCPQWLDLLCHFNPTSIIWRYAAIADRRIRAIGWCPEHLAATNAIFWTRKGWNGDERMVHVTMLYCIQKPRSSHVELYSATTLKTTIVTLQGVSGLYSVIVGFTNVGEVNPISNMGLDVVFYPLSIIGLLRLCAAAWITEDFAYTDVGTLHGHAYNEDGLLSANADDDSDPWLTKSATLATGFKSPNTSWSSYAFRAFYFLICSGIWTLSLLSLVPFGGRGRYDSLTSLLANLTYSVFLTVSNAIYAVYFLQDKTTTTVIPCISSKWYKFYTLVLVATMLGLITISALDTQRLPNGGRRSRSGLGNLNCESRFNVWAVSAKDALSGLVSPVSEHANISKYYKTETFGNATVANEEYLLYNFTGYCIGESGRKQVLD